MKKLRSDQKSAPHHQDSPVVIGYMNPACRFLPTGGIDYESFFKRASWRQASVPRLRKGGVGVAVVSFGLNDPDLFPGGEGIARVLQHIGAFREAVRNHKDEVGIVHTAADIGRIRRVGKIALILHLTGVRLGGSLGLLEACHAVGVRAIHPPFDTAGDRHADTWATDVPLSALGRKVVRRMQTLGMVVDLAHASDRMFREVLRIVEGPVVVSHGACRVISPTKRNMTDAQIRAVAATGGVIGIHFAGQLIDEEHLRQREKTDFIKELRRWENRLKREHPDRFDYLAHRYDYRAWTRTRAYQIQQGIPLPHLDKLLDHIDHLVDLVGIDHVGIGADYDLGNIPAAINRADKLDNLTHALLERGYSRQGIRKIWGNNFLRVYRAVLRD